MTAAALTGASALGTVAVVSAVWAAVWRHLQAVLRELCVLEHRARFWGRICAVELAVGVALAATLGAWTGAGGHVDPVLAAVSIVRWALAGGIAGILAIALVVRSETARVDRAAPQGGAGGDDARAGSP